MHVSILYINRFLNFDQILLYLNLYFTRVFIFEIAITMQANPFSIIKHIGPNITHIDGLVNQILILMGEKCNFT